MIEENVEVKIETQQTRLAQEIEACHLETSNYDAEQRTMNSEYVQHLRSALYGNCVAMSEEAFADEARYSNVNSEEQHPLAHAPLTNVAPEETREQEHVLVFNKSRLPWLIAFVAIALAAILTLLFTVPGTAWEKKNLTVASGTSVQAAPVDVAHADVPFNTIALADGTTKTVELTPYQQTQPAEDHSNWFDSFCDWLNGLIGG